MATQTAIQPHINIHVSNTHTANFKPAPTTSKTTTEVQAPKAECVTSANNGGGVHQVAGPASAVVMMSVTAALLPSLLMYV